MIFINFNGTDCKLYTNGKVIQKHKIYLYFPYK